MKKTNLALLTLLAILVVLAAGCSSSNTSARPVQLTAANLKFGAAEMAVKLGEPVELTLANQDPVLHDFSIDQIPVKNVQQEHMAGDHDMGEKRPDLHLAVDAGKSGSIRFTPAEVGSYTYYCTVPGHKGAGMAGTLVVQ